jgi:lysophospholipase L1-like esterase
MEAISRTPERAKLRLPVHRRLWVFRALTMLLGFALGLVVVEVGLRIIENRSLIQDPGVINDLILAARYAPNAPGHDARGFRNPQALSKADVVVLGDSQTWGVNVQPTEAWPLQLGRLSGLSVYNMGVGSYGPAQYLKLTDQALELSPRTVVVGLYLGNDLYDAYNLTYRNDAYADMRLAQPNDDLKNDTILPRSIAFWNEEKEFHRDYGRGSLAGSTVWLREHTAIGRLLNRARWWPGASDLDFEIDRDWARAHPEHGLVCEDENVRTVFTTAYRLAGQDLDDPRVAEGLRITKVVLERIRDKVRGRANLTVVMIPTKELVYAELMKSRGTTNATYLRDLEMERKSRADLISWFRENGIQSIDVLPQMQDAIGRRQQLYPSTTESHPDAGGYTVIAGVVNDALRNSPR